MAQAPAPSRIVKFGIFVVDLGVGELHKAGVRQKVAGQAFEVLRLLLEHPQQIVTREELQRRMWPQDTFVDYDLALRKAVTRLREVLGDSADSPRFIETIPRKGYRFIASLSPNVEVGSELPAPTATLWSRRSLRLGVQVCAGIVVLSGSILGFLPSLRHRLFGSLATSQIRSLAVLPFANLSADPTQEYFSDGVTDGLITDLAQLGTVKVVSRTSTIQYKQTKKPIPEIARELNVDGIVEGTVQRSADRVRITAQLIHASSDKHLWANSYERDSRDILALERDVTEDIAHQIQARLTTGNRTSLAQPRPVNSDVLEVYLQGNYRLQRFSRGAGDNEKREAAQYFQQAVNADPSFAPAYNGIAKAHLWLLSSSKQDADIVMRAAERAAALDPNLSDPHKTLGDAEFASWNWRRAEDEYRSALALNPNNAQAHTALGFFLCNMGRTEEGLKEYRIAQELDPTGDHHRDVDASYFAGEYDRAIAVAQGLLQIDPEDGYLHHALYRYYAKKGMLKEASREAEKVLDLFGDPAGAARVHHALATSGGSAGIRQIALELERWMTAKRGYFPGNLAAVYAILGNKDRAFYWLEEAYKHHDEVKLATDIPLETLKWEPVFDSLRSDPRFADLERRIGLPQ